MDSQKTNAAEDLKIQPRVGVVAEWKRGVHSLKKTERLGRRLISFLLKANPPILNHCEFRPVKSVQEFKAATQLVYLEYLRKKYLQPNDAQMRVSLFQFLKISTPFIATYQKKYLLATMTLVEDSPMKLPMDKVFKDELDALRRGGHRLIECGMLAQNQKFLNHPSVPLQLRLLIILRLFRAGFMYINQETTATTVTACFHPRHEAFYAGLRFRPFPGIKKYESVQNNPAVGSFLDLRKEELASSQQMREFLGLDSGKKPDHQKTPKLTFDLADFADIFLQAAKA